MAFPRATSETGDICTYTADVVGRLVGLSKAETYIVDQDSRNACKTIADEISIPLAALKSLYGIRVADTLIQQRRALGEGRSVDRAFDRHVANVGENVRTGPAGGSRTHVEYRKVFEDGSMESFQSPTIRDDAELAVDLGERLGKVVDFPQRAALIDNNTKLVTLIKAVATTLMDIEKSISKEFTHEVELRQAVIDALWVGKKEFEKTFVRDYPLTRFVFFPFQKGNANSDPSNDSNEGGNTPVSAPPVPG
jgi:hypothetical protein